MRPPPPNPTPEKNGFGRNPSGISSDTNDSLDDVAEGTGHTIGQGLEHMFQEYFTRKSGSRSNIFQNSIASFLRRTPQSSLNKHSQAPPSILASDGQLSFLAQGMVEILFLRFGHLGCEQPDQSSRNFYVSSLAADTMSSMFDSRNQRNPISALGNHHILQLVDVWFSTHPLSPLISKTLLVSEVKDGNVDYALLASILADASKVHSDTGSPGVNEHTEDDGGSADRFWHFAATQLKCRRLEPTNANALSTVQALFLLGWRDISLGHARRGTCYIGYACNIVARMNQLWRNGRRPNSPKLNGVAIDDVKKELLQNVYWLCLSTTTWAFMQIDQPFSLLVPDETPDFPNPDETASAVLRLDRASSNISTLQAQIRSMQQLWPLSHVTSTVAHVYTLYLNAATEAQQVQEVPWQKQHLHRLHQLFRARLNSPTLPLEIRGILLQAIQAVECEVSSISPQSCLLTTYHTIAIHTLFSGVTADQAPLQISPAVIRAFCQSTSAILTIAEKFKFTPPTTDYGRITVGTSTLALALDSCSRALLRIYEQTEGGSLDEYNVVVMMRDELADYAEQLHQISRIDLLSLRGSVVRPVKKRLKNLKQLFRSLGPSTGFGPNPFCNGRGNDNTGVSKSFQGKDYQDLTEKDVSFGPLLSDDPHGVESDPILEFQLSKEIADPCSFVSEPAIGCPLGFPSFTRMGTGMFERQGQPDDRFDTQQGGFSHPVNDLLQYPISANSHFSKMPGNAHMGDISLNNPNGQGNTSNGLSGIIPSVAGIFHPSDVSSGLLKTMPPSQLWAGTLEGSEVGDFRGFEV